MTDVFISYTRADRDRARALAEAIAAKGYDVWWDVELLPGEKFADEIESIIMSAKAAVVLWSERSVKSTFVAAEARMALRQGILIPAWLDRSKPPLPFSELHTLDLTNWEGDPADLILEPLLLAIEKKSGVKSDETPAEPIPNVLAKPEEEASYWRAVSESSVQSIHEYRLYLNKFGQKATFAQLAQLRIEKLGKERYSRWWRQWPTKVVSGATAAILLVTAIVNLWPDPPAFDPSPIFDVSISGHPYEIEYSGQEYRFYPDTPYLRAMFEGDGIVGLNKAGTATPYDFDFPSLDVKVVNNTGRTIYLTQALVEVTESRLDRRPLIEVWNNNWCLPATVFFINQGWGAAIDASVRFNAAAYDAPAFSNRSEDGLITSSSNLENQFSGPFAVTKNLGNIEEKVMLDFLDDLKVYGVEVRSIRSIRDNPLQSHQALMGSLWDSGARHSQNIWIYGIFEYSDEETSERKSLRFLERSTVLWDGCGSMGAPSAEYEDVELEVDGSNYQRVIPISQYVKHGDTDRFTIRVSARKSSLHKLTIMIKYGEDEYFLSRPIQLDLLAPRRFILGGDPREDEIP